jgi:hypothetical protein
MIFFPKPASKRSTCALLAILPQHYRWTMMSINTKLQLTVLPVQTRIQSGQISYRFQILFCGFILVLETALVTFGTGTAQIVIVAEFVVGGTALDLVENSGVDGNWGIETA